MQTTTSVKYLGDFSSLQEANGHVSGYILQLWKDGPKLVGLWSKADGQPADFPTVLADDVKWDERSGDFSFTVQWCGSMSRFEGRLAGRVISGRLTPVNSTASPSDLKLERDNFEMPITTREAWQSQTEQILKRRHPC